EPEPEPEPEPELISARQKEETRSDDQTELFSKEELPAERKAAPAAEASKKNKPQQATLDFENKNKKGRFEKSEPTIEEGEDLDVPAFLRLKRRGR
ncbi:MAG: hypothetical protein ACK5NG_04595, partial [Chthoniobacterales bacterium]